MKSRNNHSLTVTAEADNLDAATSSLFFEKLPRLDFEVCWNNIFNSKKYVSYYSGAFSVQETIYTLRPMEVLASVRFRF